MHWTQDAETPWAKAILFIRCLFVATAHAAMAPFVCGFLVFGSTFTLYKLQQFFTQACMYLSFLEPWLKVWTWSIYSYPICQIIKSNIYLVKKSWSFGYRASRLSNKVRSSSLVGSFSYPLKVHMITLDLKKLFSDTRWPFVDHAVHKTVILIALVGKFGGGRGRNWPCSPSYWHARGKRFEAEGYG